KGANAGLNIDPTLVPSAVRGPFGVVGRNTDGTVTGATRLAAITDGTSTTIALGEAIGGSARFQVRRLDDPSKAVTDPFSGQLAIIEQSWGATGFGDRSHPWYGGVLAVTAQFGM